MTQHCHSDNGVSFMAFSVPTFNLVCNIYTGPWLTKVLRIADCPCNLALGRRSQKWMFIDTYIDYMSVNPNLLLPALTDIRDLSTVSPAGAYADIVECPSGTGRWYWVNSVDDVGKGFDNEYRMAGLQKILEFMDPVNYAGAKWPTPIP